MAIHDRSAKVDIRPNSHNAGRDAEKVCVEALFMVDGKPVSAEQENLRRDGVKQNGESKKELKLGS